jgi:hypothetical protein
MNPHRGHVGRITPCSLFGRIRVPQSAQKRAFGRAGMMVFGLRFRRLAPGAPDRGIVLVPRESAESDHFLSVENDSQDNAGHRAHAQVTDSREHLGREQIGPEPFARFLRDPRFRAVPKLLETPKGKDGVVMDRRNLAFPRRLAEETV